jgi:hypothetical protein
VFEKLANGEELQIPNFGLETVHHVHADDVAQAFECAINHWSTSSWRSLPCGFTGGTDPARLCSVDRALVWAGA